MLIQWNSVKSTDIIDTYSQWDVLAKHELLSVLSLPKDETFISPDKLVQLKQFSSNFFKRHRYAFSGRSFSKWFSHKGKLYEFMVKWGHLLKNGEIYDPQIQGLWTPVAWWSESAPRLYNEYTAAYDIQNLYLEIFWELAPIPVPLKVTRLDTYNYKWEQIDYKAFMEYVFASIPTHETNLGNVVIDNYPEVAVPSTINPWGFRIKEEFLSFEKLFDLYRRAVGEHGSYQYICQWTSMRLADVFKAPTKTEMQKTIRSFYPKQSDEEICKIFMNNFWKARAAVSWSNYMYKPWRVDGCLLADTTVMWHAMDIDGHTFSKAINQEQWINMLKQQRTYLEVCHLFYSIFFTESFMQFYEKHFISSFVDTYFTMGEYVWRIPTEHKEKFKTWLTEICGDQAELQLKKNTDEKRYWANIKYFWNILEVTWLGKIWDIVGYSDAEDVD